MLAHAERERSEIRLQEAQAVAHIGSWEWDVAQDAIDVADFARSNDFVERRLNSRESALSLPSLGVALALSDIYRDTGLT